MSSEKNMRKLLLCFNARQNPGGCSRLPPGKAIIDAGINAISISKTDLQTYICQRLDHDHARYQVASDKEHDIEFVCRTNI